MRFNLLLALTLFLVTSAYAQTSTKLTISVNAPQHKEQKVFLGSYLGGNTYAVDSAFTDKAGKATLKPESKIEKGQYILYILPDVQCDLLFAGTETDVYISIDKNDVKNKITGAPDTELLWKYLNGRRAGDEKVAKLNDEMAASTDTKKTELMTRINASKQELGDYMASYVQKHEGTWFASFLKGSEPIDVPLDDPQTQEEYVAYRQYAKEHYFDNINLAEPAYWRTNYMSAFIDDYMDNWVEADPDSLAIAASRLVAKTKTDDYCFNRMLSRFVNESQASVQLGRENIWARLFEDYIKDGNLDWITDAEYNELFTMYKEIENCRIGQVGMNLDLLKADGSPFSTDSIDADYLLLYFYDSNCGYCQINTPILHDSIYAKYKDYGFEVVAFFQGDSEESWKEFVDGYNLHNWINAYDPEYKSEYWLKYNLKGYPSMYLLDKNKTIIAKRIDVSSLAVVMDRLLKVKNGTD